MFTALALLIGIYAALVVCIYVFQRRLMYHPVRTLATPAVYGLTAVTDLFIISADGTKLEVWKHAARPGFPTIVYFHGNAFHLGDRAAKFSGFIDAGFGLLAVSYRGFGRSEGHPSEAGIYADASAGVTYALEEMRIPPAQLIYFGESLGTGVAVQMATERPPALLALEAAYTSVETRSAELYPFVLGVRSLVLDKYDSLSKIKNVHAPLLMLHGEDDPIIPVAHGRALFAAANEPKQLVVYPGVHHADFTSDQTTVPLLNAARKYGLLKT